MNIVFASSEFTAQLSISSGPEAAHLYIEHKILLRP